MMSNAKKEAEFKAAVEKFHTRYDADLKKIIAGTSEVKGIEYTGGRRYDHNDPVEIHKKFTITPPSLDRNGWVIDFHLPAELKLLQTAINYKSPARIATEDRDTYIEYADGIDRDKRMHYSDAKELLALITKTLPQLKKQATQEADLAGGDSEKLSDTGRKVVEVYDLLRSMVKEWKQDDYLSKLERMGIDIARARDVAASELEREAKNQVLKRSSNNLDNILKRLSSESKRAK
jgi:hypothetical protein